MKIYLGAQTNPGKTHADNRAMAEAMKIFLCMGGPSEGSNAGTHAISQAMKVYLTASGNPSKGTAGDARNIGETMSKVYLGMSRPGPGAVGGTNVTGEALSKVYLGVPGAGGKAGKNVARGVHPDAGAMGSRIYLGMAHGGTGNKESNTAGSPGQTARAIEGEDLPLPVLRILLSYHYYRDEEIDKLLAECFGDLPIDVFADSGAFSAFTVGKPINEGDYIAWVNRWKHCFTAVSAPDVIGDPSATEAATERMLGQVEGIPVLPVFHVGEPWSFLEKWCADERIDYLALGGMVPYTRRLKLLDAWLVKAFKIIPDRMCVHGFGLTTWPLLLRHPFYSVDSSSWTAGFRFAQLQLFDDARGKFIDVAMGQNAELLKHARLLESYGLRPTQAQASGYNRDQIVAVAVQSWQRAEAWLVRKKGVPVSAYLSCGANPGGPNAKAGTGDVRSLGTGLGTRKGLTT
jgi:hypothetical protein